MVNGPMKNEKSWQILPLSFGISHNLLMGLRISDFVSVRHIFAFLSSHYSFSSRTRILRCQSRRLGVSASLGFAIRHHQLWGKSVRAHLRPGQNQFFSTDKNGRMEGNFSVQRVYKMFISTGLCNFRRKKYISYSAVSFI